MYWKFVLLLFFIPTDQWYQIEAHEIHHGTSVVSRSFENNTGDRYGLARFHPNFEGKHPEEWSGPSYLIFFFTNFSKGHTARGMFRLLPCRTSTMQLKPSTCLLRDSNPSPTTQQQLALLTITPDGQLK
ncbi:hypothetical protein TNCV_79531 [Trichonephila clavipes]|nr:hypothetical protein TNCV_79531 [Trichonephila clavipes]